MASGAVSFEATATDVSDELYEALTGCKPADVRRRMDRGTGWCPWVDDQRCDAACEAFANCRKGRR